MTYGVMTVYSVMTVGFVPVTVASLSRHPASGIAIATMKMALKRGGLSALV
jgi:hypothetical protein